jgi:engulfment and cell motility protein 1
MYSTAMRDLTGPILDFQNLAKLLAKRWRDYAVDRKKKDCRKVLGLLQRAVTESPENIRDTMRTTSKDEENEAPVNDEEDNDFDWTKLGFETNDPTAEINGMGFLGLLDFASFVQRDTESFNKVILYYTILIQMVLEQLAKPPHLRCPIARTSVAITSLLYDQFSLSTATDTPADFSSLSPPDSPPTLDPDECFQPLYLQWLRIHSSAVKSFLRLWRDTGAEGPDDFPKIVELQRVLITKVIKSGTRELEIYDVEKDMETYAADWKTLRREQMDARELEQQEAWGEPLKLLAERLHREAEEFIREQRISCLLQGEWFDNTAGPLAVRDGVLRRGSVDREGAVTPTPDSKRGGLPLSRGGRWRYVRLKGDRKTLCWGDFEVRKEGRKIRLDELCEQGISFPRSSNIKST